MSAGHNAKAIRVNGPGAVWHAWCPRGCTIPRAHSKEQAEWLATEHRLRSGISEAARHVSHTCYFADEMEYHPEVCARCILDALESAA